MAHDRRKFWGWGLESETLGEARLPALFGAALAAAKHALDPDAILNPGVLLPPRS